MRKNVPLEFVRRPRSFSELPRCKAAELRQFSLYTVPVVSEIPTSETHRTEMDDRKQDEEERRRLSEQPQKGSENPIVQGKRNRQLRRKGKSVGRRNKINKPNKEGRSRLQ